MILRYLYMYTRPIFIFLKVTLCIWVFAACQSQQNSNIKELIDVGGPCEGCEAAYEYGNRELTASDTIVGFDLYPSKIKIEGTVYDSNGRPAPGVILYFYHTDPEGIYRTDDNSTNWGLHHGIHRTWLQTGKDGTYTLYTFRPASYPNSTIEQHIHITVLEPGKTPYYIDSIVFDDDPFLTPSHRSQLEERGGTGIISLVTQGEIKTARRDIYLGRNIPNYPG